MSDLETFIRMCDCPEIQGAATWDDGDFVCQVVKTSDYKKGFFPNPCWTPLGDGRYYSVETVCSTCEQEFGSGGSNGLWLPHFTQTLKMVDRKLDDLLFDFFCFCWEAVGGGCFEGRTKYTKQFTSMEQLGVAFVMNELHNKTWSNGRWVLGPDDVMPLDIR